MLKSLYTLSHKYANKKIIVYGVNRNSVNLFTDLALNHQIDVHAFLDMDDRFTKESFVNRRIINIRQLQHMEDIVVIIPDAYPKPEVCQRLGQATDIFYKEEVLNFNEELKGKQIYIYGIGKKGAEIYDALKRKGIEPKGVCVTKPGRIGRWCGKEVLSVGHIGKGEQYAVILADDNRRSFLEMLVQLTDLAVGKYVSCFVNDYVGGNFFQAVNAALLKDKKIWLCSSGDENAAYLKQVLKLYQIEIRQEVCAEDIYELKYKDINDISVIVAERDAYKSEQICDTLESLGFRLERLDYTAIVCCVYKADCFSKATKKDILLGNISYVTEKYPGYVVYGDEKQAKVRIMVLGNSSSTCGLYRSVPWVEFLYKKLSESGYDPIIYNGAVCSYGIVDEFLHMTRDIGPLHPDYVISFSGVNNTFTRKAVNQFNTVMGEWIVKTDQNAISGIQSSEALYDFWCRISKLMKLTAAAYGAKLYSFLQPMSAAKEELDLMETTLYDTAEQTGHIREYKRRAVLETNKFYINTLSMLEDKKEMFIDMVHYSTEANRLIAETVFETIRPDIERSMK